MNNCFGAIWIYTKAQVVISTFSSVTCEQHVNAIHEKWKDNQSLQEVSLTQQILNSTQQLHFINSKWYTANPLYKRYDTQLQAVSNTALTQLLKR